MHSGDPKELADEAYQRGFFVESIQIAHDRNRHGFLFGEHRITLGLDQHSGVGVIARVR